MNLNHVVDLLYLIIGAAPLKNALEHRDKMRLGMSLNSNPKDNSFVVGMIYFYFNANYCLKTFCVNTLI